jgi:hypothetical protein
VSSVGDGGSSGAEIFPAFKSAKYAPESEEDRRFFPEDFFADLRSPSSTS